MNEKNRKILFKTSFILISVLILACVSCTMPTGPSGVAPSDGGPITVGTSRAIASGPFTSFTLEDVTHQWMDITQNNNNRIAIADIQTFEGNDPCNVRFDINDNNQNLRCKIEEEYTYNDELNHTYAEKVAGLFVDAQELTSESVDGKGELYDINGEYIGNAVYTNITQESWDQTFTITVPFKIGIYHAPVVFANVRTYGGSQAIHTRIKNIEYKTVPHSGYWEISYKLEEWENNYDGRHNQERVDFLILKPGIHIIGSVGSYPILIEVGNYEMRNRDIDYNDENDWVNVDLITKFMQYAPIVITQSQSFKGNQQCVTRNKDIENDSFKTIIQEEEKRYKGDGDRLHNAETIGYLAFGITVHDAYHSSIVENNGCLDVDNNNNLVNEDGQAVRLTGVSSFWLNWDEGKKYANDDVISWLVYDWKIKVYRAAMGVRPTDPAGLPETYNLDLGKILEPRTGYADNPEEVLETVETVIRSCIRRGIYVIVDWHVHDALRDDNEIMAVEFFDYISEKYGMYDNIIYEIWNEPGWENHVRFPGLDSEDWNDRNTPDHGDDEASQYSWSTIKNYCIDIIEVIRQNDGDNIIICPSPCWDQWIDQVAANPIDTGDSNYARHIMYAFHFYAGSHMIEKNGNNNPGDNPTPAALVFWGGYANDWPGAEDKAKEHLTANGLYFTPAPSEFGMDPVWVKFKRLLWQWNFDPWKRLDSNINSLPIFVTEWGASLYDGGQVETSTEAYTETAAEWMVYMNDNNLSWCNWSICDKNEGAAALRPGSSTSGGWSQSDLTESGAFIRGVLRQQ
ncbi:MAG: glycoside hydrolase family 5 protein [Spirochaetales bacterium]|nr:glycoside hydrolase family 5 protein [Spirochaetales bacterium]